MLLQPKRAHTGLWLTPNGAARLAGCSRATITAAIRRGDIRAYCDRCQTAVNPEELTTGHDCTLGKGTQPGGAYRIVVRPADVKRYEIDDTHRASGIASAKSKAKKASAA